MTADDRAFVAVLVITVTTPLFLKVLVRHWQGHDVAVFRGYVERYWPFAKFASHRLVPTLHVVIVLFWSIALWMWGDRFSESLGVVGEALRVVGATIGVVTFGLVLSLVTMRRPRRALPPWARCEQVSTASTPDGEEEGTEPSGGE